MYRFFGADEPNYAYLPDGQTLLRDIGELGSAYFRAHNLMTTGDGRPGLKWGSTNMYTEDSEGNPVYDWTIVDRIFDAYLAAGVRPYVQIGFMPKAMSTHPDPYEHHWKPGDPYSDIYAGWAYPPKDYDAWRELVYQWTLHCVERYGRAEVEQWYWQVWNESNATGGYWQGTPEEFRKLHDYAIDGVRRALPTARVGGPHSAGPGGQWTRDFLEHCLTGTNHATGTTGTPLDFVSFHSKGSPTVVDGAVRMGIADQLRGARDGFDIVASYPQLRDIPVVIGEYDPDGCAACCAQVYPENAYRNTQLYASYTAASFARTYDLAQRCGVNLEGALTWSFEFEDSALFAGFRVLNTTGGINLPVFNVFRMFSRMTGERAAVTSTGAVDLDTMLAEGVRGPRPDVSALAAVDADQVAVLVWHYHDDDVPGPATPVELSVRGLAIQDGHLDAVEYRVDGQHSNAHTAWLDMGSPAQPTPQQLAVLRRAGELTPLGDPRTVAVSGGAAVVTTTLPRQAVSLFVLSWRS